MWDGRKLQGILRDLVPLEEEGKVEGFFNNAENAGKLGDLVEDVRDAVMDYQVCVLSLWISIRSNVCVRLRCSKGSMTDNKGSTTDNKVSTINNKISTRNSKISTIRVARSW